MQLRFPGAMCVLGVVIAAAGLLGEARGRAAVQDPVNAPRGALLSSLYDVTTLCTPMPVNIGRRVMVATGAELQRALDNVAASDTILLTPGAVFTPVLPEGSFVLRSRPLPQGQWVTVRSASPQFDQGGSIPPNTRVDPSNAALMPHLRTSTANAPVIRAEGGAHGYRLIGLDVGVDPSVSRVTVLIELGSGSETAVAAEPADITIDRSYLHGNDDGDFRRGVTLNGARLAVIESYLENFHDANGDSQAILGLNGPGPFKIVNNFLEAASENVMFGGGDPAVPSLVPSDIEIRRNLFTKRLSWQAAGVPVKNAFELKNARRVLVDGNVFEHSWVSGQDGTAILLKSANQDGRCPWCVTEYVTFRNNIVRGAANGVLINAAESGRDNVPLPLPANHMQFENVLFEDIGGRQWGAGGNLLRVFGGVPDVSFTHLTSRSNPNTILVSRDDRDVNPRLVFKYNIVERMLYGLGVGGDEGTKELNRNFTPFTYGYNVLVNTSGPTDQAISDSALTGRYPGRTWVVSGWDRVGFVAGSSRLAPTSQFARAGDDRKDIGVDLDAINAAGSGPGGSSCAPAR